jgi:hypothetical protein
MQCGILDPGIISKSASETSRKIHDETFDLLQFSLCSQIQTFVSIES